MALLLLSAAYAVTYFLNRERLIAPVTYVLSYLAVGGSSWVVLLGIGKADGWSDVRETLMWGGLLYLGPALILAAAMLYWTARRKQDHNTPLAS